MVIAVDVNEANTWNSRKFLIGLGSLVVITVLMFIGKLSQESYVSLFEFVSGAYLFAQGAVDVLKRT